ncbi:MAG: hypothetical protein AAGI38_01365 [Bacteroidota bacterium]
MEEPPRGIFQSLKAYVWSSNRNQGVALFFSFLLATFLWFLVTLNKEYASFISYPLKVVDVPAEILITQPPAAELQLQAKGMGIDLMAEHMKFRRDTLAFPFESFRDNSFILTQDYLGQVRGKAPNGLQVLKILPDSLIFSFSKRTSKRVPLVFNSILNLKPTYHIESDPILAPDSVTLIGPADQLDTLTEWFTAKVSTEEVTESGFITLPIESREGLRVNPSTATLRVDPRPFTQEVFLVKLVVTDIPPNTEVRLSNPVVELSCMVPLMGHEQIVRELGNSQDTTLLEIPFSQLDPELTSIIPELTKLPEGIQVISRKPLQVGYLIMKTL